MFLDLASGLSIMQGNKFWVLAIGSAQRSKLLPDVPTLTEVGVPNTEVFALQGVLGPAGLPAPVEARLNAELNKAFTSATIQKRFNDFSMEAMPGTPERFAALSRAERSAGARSSRPRESSLIDGHQVPMAKFTYLVTRYSSMP